MKFFCLIIFTAALIATASASGSASGSGSGEDVPAIQTQSTAPAPNARPVDAAPIKPPKGLEAPAAATEITPLSELTPIFRPNSWSKGVHLLTGFGLNTAVFNSDDTHQTLGLGSNFKTDVGLYLNDHFAAEVGSAVKFNRSGDYLVWDTLFTIGVRYRFHSYLFNSDNVFLRAFAGDSPTVIYLGDSKNPLKATGASRAQIDGPLAGFGGGCFFKTEKGLNWFIEWDATYQWLRYQDAIVDQNDVPIVLQSSDTQNHPKIFSLALNVGLVLF